MTPSLRILSDLQDELREAVPAASHWDREPFLRHIKEVHKHGSALMTEAHHEGVGGLELCEARAFFMDALLSQLWGHALVAVEKESGKHQDPASCAMVAIGGYGRGELSPGSDIDLLFVFSKRSPSVSRLVRVVLYLALGCRSHDRPQRPIDHRMYPDCKRGLPERNLHARKSADSR